MNKLKGMFIEHIGFFIVAFVGFIVICLIVASPDIIGKNFFPKKYWSELVNDLEKNVEFLENEIKNARIDLQKEIITTPLEVSRFEDEKTRELTLDLKKKQIELNQKQIVLLEASLNKRRYAKIS